MARATSPRPVAKVRPTMAAREEGSSVGVPLPAKWGITSRLVGCSGASARIIS